MCGIMGYVGARNAVDVLLGGMRRLEYRGYDSAGVAVCPDSRIDVRKTAGRLERLEELLREEPLPAASIGIGHTRWATHGRPSDYNAHPHLDDTGDFVVVHNGIIENYAEIRGWLASRGHRFNTETDTEVIPHLIRHFYRGDLLTAVLEAVRHLRGAYALAVLSRHEPDRLVAVKQASPLIIGLGRGENFIASDVPAILPYTREVLVLEEGEVALVTRDGVRVFDAEGRPVEKQAWHVEWDVAEAERGGYPHFMLKEIFEQPRAIRDTMRGRVDWAGGRVVLDEACLLPEGVREVDKVMLVACGTAYHASLVGRHLVERWARLPAEADLASEFRYRDPLCDERTLVIVVSQSGETADTLAALREARRRGATCLAVTNALGSSVAREADFVLYTWAGPEIAVASTKAYVTQLVALTLLALYLAQAREGQDGMPAGVLDERGRRAVLEGLRMLPEKAEQVLARAGEVRRLARRVAGWRDCFFIGRGLDYAVAMEGQLKLKEISYIHAEAYAAGELKHGSLALIEEGVPVVAVATQPDLMEKTLSNVAEVRTRGGRVLMVAPEDQPDLARHADHLLLLPSVHPCLAPVLAVLPLQLLAYYAAVERGTDVDKPRNLAKSVTVE